MYLCVFMPLHPLSSLSLYDIEDELDKFLGTNNSITAHCTNFRQLFLLGNEILKATAGLEANSFNYFSNFCYLKKSSTLSSTDGLAETTHP